MIETAPVELAAMPFVAAAALVAVAGFHVWRVWKSEHRVYVGDIIYPVVFLAFLLFFGFWTALGFVGKDNGFLVYAVYSAAMLLLGVGTLSRNWFARAIGKIGFVPSSVIACLRDISIMLIVATISAWLIDYIWLEDSLRIAAIYLLATGAIFFVFEFILYFIGQCTSILTWIIPIAAMGFGIGQAFLLQFKGAPILPSDLLSLGTAAAVAGGYDYILTQRMVIGIAVVAACLFLLSFLTPPVSHKSIKCRLASVGVNLSLAVFLSFGAVTLYSNVKIEDLLSFECQRWHPIETYVPCGFIPTFISLAQDLAIPEPIEYADERALELQANLVTQYDSSFGSTSERLAAQAQFEEIKPTVITVMNETFTDMSLYEAIAQAGYTGPFRYNSLADTIQRGTLMASVVGGGTANTEFEYLTGFSSGFIGYGKYPYQLYGLSGVDSIVKQFGALGYATTAMHPMDANNWNRKGAYNDLGFDTFLDIADFEGAPWYHSGAADYVTYDKIIELLQTDADPQFILDVTMQNHGGYAWGTVPEEDMVHLDVAGVEDEDLLTQLGVYLACIERSDQDLERFIAQLRDIGRPVVLVFFGDHQPSFAPALNDALYPGEDELSHEMRTYESTYFIWSNYEIAGGALGDVREVSAAELGTYLLYKIGAPLNDYQKAQLVLNGDVSAVSMLGYRGNDGVRYVIDADSPYKSYVDRLQTLQYLNFARKIH